MNFQSLKLFLKLIKEFRKRQHSQCHVSAPGRARWQAYVSMTSGGSGLLTSAVGPADASFDLSRSMGQGGVHGSTNQPLYLTGRRAHMSA
jgi:hypothetical protein